MIHEVSGDILLSKAQVICHGVAPNDPMKQGLALALHEKFPAMHKDCHHWCSQQHPAPGSVWVCSGAGGVRIVNLLTQEGGYGHGARPGKASLKHVRDALREGGLEALYQLDRLHIQGLMCIPPFDPMPEKTRPYFIELRNLRDELEKLGGAPLPRLSMGMSHDFEVAIEEGATIVRVGSAIFGARTYQKA